MNENDKLITDNVLEWVNTFVSRPSEKLNNFSPCPFAKEAIEKGHVLFLVNRDESIYLTQEKIELAARKIIAGDFEVAVIVHVKPQSWPVDEVRQYVLSWREKYKEKDLYLLKDHPEDKEIVAGLKMNQGEYLLFFVQRSSILLSARKKLLDQGYYNSWSDQEQTRVFGSLGLSGKDNKE
jgi:hypothetical protein